MFKIQMDNMLRPQHLNNNWGGSVWIESQYTDALQGPFHYHLIFPFCFSYIMEKSSKLR